MAYVSGIAVSSADLQSALISACVNNGWANPEGNIVTKGDVYIDVIEDWYGAQTNSFTEWLAITEGGLGIQAGLGQSGGTLTDATKNPCGIRTDYQKNPEARITYPLTYHIFININPDEVSMAVNYNVNFWQWLGFGQANTITNLVGTGIHCWAHSGLGNWGNYKFDFTGFRSSDYESWQLDGNIPYGGNPLFYGASENQYTSAVDGYSGSSFIHLALPILDTDQGGWWSNQMYNTVLSYPAVNPQMYTQPNSWNNESLLVRAQLIARMDSTSAIGFWSYVAEIPHIRWTRNTYLDDGQTITLGSDDWFVAPIMKKDLDTIDGSNTADDAHSGTWAFAARKTT